MKDLRVNAFNYPIRNFTEEAGVKYGELRDAMK